MEELRTLATSSGARPSRVPCAILEAHTHRNALCDPGGTQAPHRLWPGRECGAAVINLRFKARGPFGRKPTVSGLMHLRAAFKAGRWDEVMIGVLTGTCQTPSLHQ